MNFNTRERCNNVFKTCCALHNILLEWMAQEGNQKWQTVGEFDDETSGFGEFGHEEINFFSALSGVCMRTFVVAQILRVSGLQGRHHFICVRRPAGTNCRGIW